MTLTKNGICYDLKNSPYFCYTDFFTFFFDTQFISFVFEFSARSD